MNPVNCISAGSRTPAPDPDKSVCLKQRPNFFRRGRISSNKTLTADKPHPRVVQAPYSLQLPVIAEEQSAQHHPFQIFERCRFSFPGRRNPKGVRVGRFPYSVPPRWEPNLMFIAESVALPAQGRKILMEHSQLARGISERGYLVEPGPELRPCLLNWAKNSSREFEEATRRAICIRSANSCICSFGRHTASERGEEGSGFHDPECPLRGLLAGCIL